MAKWILVFTLQVKEDLKKLDKSLRKRIIEKLDWLCSNFDKIRPLTLDSEWRGFFKLRVGDWRIIYKIEWKKNLIIIYLIDRRDKIYKKKSLHKFK